MAWTPSRALRPLIATLAVLTLIPTALADAAPASRPADPGFALQWGLENRGQTVLGHKGTSGADVSARAAWSVTRGAGVQVGIVDSGVERTHRDLRLTAIEDVIGGSGDDATGHGTSIAGIIAAPADGQGVVGLAPEARVVSLRALGANNQGTDAGVAAAIDRAGALGLRVVNLSLASPDPVPATQAAIAAQPDTLFVVAAGNDGADLEQRAAYPCASDLANVICVGASDANDRPVASSNVGATAVDLFAPGGDVLAPALGSAFAYDTGSSMAAGFVTATAALLIAAKPTLDVTGLRRAILGSVDVRPALSASASGGRLDAAAALASAGAVARARSQSGR